MDVGFKQEDGQYGDFSLADGAGAPQPQMQNGSGMPMNGDHLHQDEDGRSDTSFDPLFDDPGGEDDISDLDIKPAPPPSVLPTQTPTQLSMPTTITPSSQPSARQAVGTGAAAPAPKNAPPILDPLSYTMFSPDVLMTASIDGQVMLWDRRVHTPGRGVGRLWMSEKTPPWCVSVRSFIMQRDACRL